MTKPQLIKEVIKRIDKDLIALRKAAAETHKSSTSAESKQEGKYDTRGIEAAYLAEAQAGQVAQLELGLEKLKKLSFEDEEDQVRCGSIVILSGDEDYQYILLPAGGGISLQYESEPIMVVTPESPIGSLIIGTSIADEIPDSPIGEVFVSEIY